MTEQSYAERIAAQTEIRAYLKGPKIGEWRHVAAHYEDDVRELLAQLDAATEQNEITKGQLCMIVNQWAERVEKYMWGWSPVYKGAVDDLKNKLCDWHDPT